MQLSELSGVVLADNGDILKLVFAPSDAQAADEHACGVMVEVGEDGSVTVTCEGSCPADKPHCRMTLIEADEQLSETHAVQLRRIDAGVTYGEPAGLPTAADKVKKKYRVNCNCKES